MPCAKVRYQTELDAKLALARVGRKRHERRPRSEQRAYRCQECGGVWHLTSRKAARLESAHGALG